LTQSLSEAVLLTSELVTNGIIHAQSDISVTVRAEGSLIVSVFDEGVAQLTQDNQDRLDGGRGLRLVGALALSWGVSPVERGKAVWFELAR
jgi:anti-sigma regulatory factor (Ser/Thr protein kinase)